MPKPKRRAKRVGPKQTFLLVGGAGRMGRSLAPFFRKKGYRVQICDPAGRVRGFGSANLSEASSADVVCVAASLDATPEALTAVLDRAPRGLVFDIASLKTPLLPLFARALGAGVAIASAHPMFGPSGRLAGRDFLVLDCGNASATRRLARLFSGAGLRLRRMAVTEHDPWVARTMGLAHVVALAAAGALARLEVDTGDVDGRATTSFRHLLELVGPLLEQDPALTRAIQMRNPEASHVADALAAEIQALRADLFAQDGTPLATRIAAIRRALARR